MCNPERENYNGKIFRQSYAETFTRCKQLASSLRRTLGLRRGDVVGVVAPNIPAFVELHHAVNMAGCVVNPINTRLEADSLAYIFQASRAKVIFVDFAFVAPLPRCRPCARASH